jgi:hypothetical protein
MASKLFWQALRHWQNNMPVVALCENTLREHWFSQAHTLGNVHTTDEPLCRRGARNPSRGLINARVEVFEPKVSDGTRLRDDSDAAAGMSEHCNKRCR